MSFFSRKSQVTIFIIAGLALFIIVSLSVYLATSTQVVSDSQALRRTPTSFRDYVEICTEEVSQEAITLIGLQGGYVELPVFIRSDGDAFLSLESSGRFGIPSWYHKGSFRVPSIEDMELEISFYVEDNLKSCLDGFPGYKENFDVVERSPLDVTTTISLDNVVVDLDYSLDVVSGSGNQTEHFDSFMARHDVKLGRMHELGRRIVYSEAENTNFEYALIDLMSASAEVPITTMSFSLKPERWLVNDVQRHIELLLLYNLQNVRFQGTDHAPFEESTSVYERYRGFNLLDLREERVPDEAPPEDAYEFFNLYFDPNELPESYEYDSSVSFDDISTAVKYIPNNNLNLVVRPSTGGIMTSSVARLPGTMVPFPIQSAHFSYDVNFLLELDLMDEDAFGGTGLLLRFALPVSIKSNAPDKSNVDFSIVDAPVQFDDPCENLQGNYEIRAQGLEGGMDGLDLKDVQISYDCLVFGCNLGETKAEGGTYKLTTGLPDACSAGLINAHKEGYLPAQVQHLGEDSLVLELKKVEDFNLVVNKRPSYDLSQTLPLDPRETAVVIIKARDYDAEHAFVFESASQEEVVELLAEDGNYYIEVLLLDEENDWITGGYKADFEYEYIDTVGRNTLVVNAIEYLPLPLPMDAENQYKIMQYIDDAEYAQAAAPRFI